MKKIIAFLVTLYITCFGAIQMSAQSNQVLVTLQVIPPISPYLSTYIEQPNKLLLTLKSLDNTAHRVKLKVKLEGDNGVMVSTPDNTNPPEAIEVPANIPVTIFFNDARTQNYFDLNSVTTVGITRAQLLRNQALPEGNYTICVQALDYDNGRPLSLSEPSGCTQSFGIYYIDPPQPIQPACDAVVTPTSPQNIFFSWTPPATMSGRIEYEFTLKEVPNGLNPFDVIKNNAFPTLYNSTEFGNSTLVYGVGKPELEDGKKYVWRVQAVDPSAGVQFKLNGYAEACTFTYKKTNAFVPVINQNSTTDFIPPKNAPTSAFTQYIPITTENQGTIFLPPIIYPTTISGTIKYRYPEGNGNDKKYPLSGATIRLVVDYSFQKNGETTESALLKPNSVDGIPVGYEIGVANTDMDGNYSFNFTTGFNFGLAGTNVFASLGDLDWGNGTVYRYARIEIENPHSEFYYDPKDRFMPTNGEQLKQDVTSYVKVRSNVTVGVRNDGIGLEGLEKSENELQGADVYICRKPITGWDQLIYPKEDGTPDVGFKKPEALGDLEVIAKSESNANGEAFFKNIVLHENSNYRYYVYADFQSLKSGFGNFRNVDGVQVLQNSLYDVHRNKISTFYTDAIYYTARMEPTLPSVKVHVTDEKGGKVPLDAIVSLKEVYIGNDGENIIPWANAKTSELYQKMQANNCPCNKIITTPAWVDNSDGYVSFDNLSLHFSNKPVLKMKGPSRYAKGICYGYDVKEKFIGSSLKWGERAEIELQLTRGAKIKGRVVDGETGKGISADFHFIDEDGGGQTSAWFGGYFGNYPAKKIATTQKIIFNAKGYLDDTLVVVINEKEVDLGEIKMYTIKRRLTVLVSDEKSGQIINNAKVEIVGVAGNCANGENLNCNLSQQTALFGLAFFSFENGGNDNDQQYTIRVTGPNSKEYMPKLITTKIPYSSKYKLVKIKLEPATCISGIVYAGKNNTAPVAGARVKLDQTVMQYNGYKYGGGGTKETIGETESITDANGAFVLHQVPLRSYNQTVYAIKSQSQFIGDSFIVKIKTASNSECLQHDFHLSVYNDMDITSLMGFPISVSNIQPDGLTGATIWGEFDILQGNEQFKQADNKHIQFKNLKIKPSTLKNANGIPVSEPVILPLVTEENELKLWAYGSIDASVQDKNLGINLDKTVGGKQYGVLKGKVSIPNTAFNQNVIAFAEKIHLAIPGATTDKMKIAVLNADKAVTAPNNVPNGFSIVNEQGNPLKISLPNFENMVTADPTKSFFKNAELSIDASIHTNIQDITPADLNLHLTNLKVTKTSGPVINATNNPIAMSLGQWKYTTSDWTLNANGLKVNTGKLKINADANGQGGIELGCGNFSITKDHLETNSAKLDFTNMNLLGVQPVKVTTTNTSFALTNTKVWKVYAGPGADGTAASLPNLPALGVGETIDLSSLFLYSDGNQSLAVKSKTVTLKNLLKFKPNNSTVMTVQSNMFTIPGSFDLNLQKTENFGATLAYTKAGSNLTFDFLNVTAINFANPAQMAHSFHKNYALTNGLFKASGESVEPGATPVFNSTLYYTNDSVTVLIDNSAQGKQSIALGGGQSMIDVQGGMRLQGGNWTPFTYDGQLDNMPGISDNGTPQRMKFVVNGEVEATGQSLAVKDVSTPFGNMSWTMQYSPFQMVGKCHIQEDLGGIALDAGITSVVDGQGWYFQGMGKMVLSGVGDLDFMGAFGKYSGYPTELSAGMGDIKCLPSAFTNKVSGFIFQAGLHKQLLPSIHFSIPALLTVDFKADLGLTTRVWKEFGGNNEYGLSLLAKGVVSASGSCDATCTEFGASADAQIGITGIYQPTTKYYAINGCGSVGFELGITQKLGALDICCGACSVTVNSGHKDVGVNVSYDSNSGANFDLQFQSCGSQCP